MSETQQRDFDDLKKEIRRIREEANDPVARQLVGIEITLARLVASARHL